LREKESAASREGRRILSIFSLMRARDLPHFLDLKPNSPQICKNRLILLHCLSDI
jgi:hypothetical protein